MIDDVDIGSVIYRKYITSDSILRYVRAMQNSLGSNVETLYHLIENKVEALEFHIHEGAPVVDIALEDLPIRYNTLIACINHAGTIIRPNGKTKISVGDTVIIITTHKGLGDIKDILQK